MAKSNGAARNRAADSPRAVTQIAVAGFKSIDREQAIEVRPLTILAGANSSGKSSMIQPLLLLKQTLEAPYDPGALLLDGPNVRFTSVDQMLSKTPKAAKGRWFSVEMVMDSDQTVSFQFQRAAQLPIDIRSIRCRLNGQSFDLRPNMGSDLNASLPKPVAAYLNNVRGTFGSGYQVHVSRNRCFLQLVLKQPPDAETDYPALSFIVSPAAHLEPILRDLIHLPGLRGNPQRTYPVSSPSTGYPDRFDNYVASKIAGFAVAGDDTALERIGNDLRSLGLTWKVTATAIDDTQVELKVGRLPSPARGGANDLVNIADVGFGVSQTLPVVVALLIAKPGQLVYVEQPELHLHPRAQVAMARLLANAANRGVRVIAETHSSLLLLGVQTLVAEGHLAPELVKLHWFRRDASGCTEVNSADLDAAGAFGDWPEDFADIALETESRYLNAAEARTAPK